MTEIEDLKVQVGRMQAMLEAHQHLIAALFAHSDKLKEVIKTFERLHSADRDLMYFEQFYDQEITDSVIAHTFLRDYLTKVESWHHSKQ